MGDSPDAALAAARFIASAINPLFVVLLLATPILRPPRRSEPSPPALTLRGYLHWFAYCCLGIATPVILAECGKKYQVWNGHPWFPSGHETFAASAATCLIVGRPKWAGWGIGLVMVMGWALVKAGYHDVDDVIGAVILGPVCAVGLGAVMRFFCLSPQPLP